MNTQQEILRLIDEDATCNTLKGGEKGIRPGKNHLGFALKKYSVDDVIGAVKESMNLFWITEILVGNYTLSPEQLSSLLHSFLEIPNTGRLSHEVLKARKGQLTEDQTQKILSTMTDKHWIFETIQSPNLFVNESFLLYLIQKLQDTADMFYIKKLREIAVKEKEKLKTPALKYSENILEMMSK